jgi:hypothetical protein
MRPAVEFHGPPGTGPSAMKRWAAVGQFLSSVPNKNQKDAVQVVGVALAAAQGVRDREHGIAVIEQRGDDAVPAR